MPPQTRYEKSDEVNIAYQVVGEGPIDLVFVPGFVYKVRDLDIELRAGLHTGECEVIGEDIGGLAVNIGARIGALAGAGEVVVSSTVKDLVVGSGISFSDRGAHQLKGVPGEWRLFDVDQVEAPLSSQLVTETREQFSDASP
jgi:class 3 adenylate cyclase